MKYQPPDKQQLNVIHNYLTWMNLTENWIYTQAKCLPASVESHIVCKQTNNLDQFQLPNIHCLREKSTWQYVSIMVRGLFALRQKFRQHSAHLIRVAKEKNVSIVHSHYGYHGWRYMNVIKKAGLKHVVTFYGMDMSRKPKENPIWLNRYKDMFSLVDAVLCEGPHMAKCIINMGCSESKVRVHHLGIMLDDIPFIPRQWVSGTPFRVLIAASFREKKGIPYALEALGQIQNKVDIEITVIGDAGSNLEGKTEKQKIKAVIKKYNLSQKVRFLGYQPLAKMREEAYRHHVFLSPSVTCSNGDTEGGAPVCIIEMAASGMPIISTKHCDIPEVIQDGVGGLLAEERDVKGLVKHLNWLIYNPGGWDSMTMAARKHIEAEYDGKKQGNRLAAIYKDVVKIE